jgi:hypothetical protein
MFPTGEMRHRGAAGAADKHNGKDEATHPLQMDNGGIEEVQGKRQVSGV